jgi:hypothetical protein
VSRFWRCSRGLVSLSRVSKVRRAVVLALVGLVGLEGSVGLIWSVEMIGAEVGGLVG